jgi:glycerate dehydrogenase
VAARRGQPAQTGRVPFEEVIAGSDILSLHCPLTEETRGLIGAKELSAMKKGAVLINAARGGVVDEQALLHALRSGHLGGAGVDVLSEEPPVHGNPLLVNDLPNLIVTPHIAWASRESRQRLVNEIAENIAAFLAGKQRNRVV